MNRAPRKSLTFFSIPAVAAGLPAAAAEPSLVESFDRLDASVWKTYGRGSVSVERGAPRIADCFVAGGDENWRNCEIRWLDVCSAT